MFTNILVAVDGSEHSRRAVRYASDIAEKYKASLHIVHAPQIEIETLSLGSGSLGVLPTHERIEALGKPVMEKAQAWAKDAGHEADATSILTGDTTECILGYAEQNGVDLIVSGSRGLGNLRGLLQGSISQKLTAHSSCPVLTVR